MSRPFWRDYVVAYLLIGSGTLIIDRADTWHRWSNRPRLVAGMAVFFAGMIILLTAIGSSLIKFRRGTDPSKK